MKKAISVFLLVCMLCGMLASCKKTETFTADDALSVVLADLGTASAKATSPHIHEGDYEGKPCFNIYITVDGMSLQYIVSTSGKILHKGPGEHSH